MDVHAQDVKEKVAQELGHTYRMSRDAGNWMCAAIFDEGQCGAITGDPAMGPWKSGDLVEFVPAPVSPGASALWPRSNTIRVYNELGEATAQAGAEHGMGAVIPRGVRSLTDDEGEGEQAEKQTDTVADMQGATDDDPLSGYD